MYISGINPFFYTPANPTLYFVHFNLEPSLTDSGSVALTYLIKLVCLAIFSSLAHFLIPVQLISSILINQIN